LLIQVKEEQQPPPRRGHAEPPLPGLPPRQPHPADTGRTPTHHQASAHTLAQASTSRLSADNPLVRVELDTQPAMDHVVREMGDGGRYCRA
jgi:hypothetical protein